MITPAQVEELATWLLNEVKQLTSSPVSADQAHCIHERLCACIADCYSSATDDPSTPGKRVSRYDKDPSNTAMAGRKILHPAIDAAKRIASGHGTAADLELLGDAGRALAILAERAIDEEPKGEAPGDSHDKERGSVPVDPGARESILGPDEKLLARGMGLWLLDLPNTLTATKDSLEWLHTHLVPSGKGRVLPHAFTSQCRGVLSTVIAACCRENLKGLQRDGYRLVLEAVNLSEREVVETIAGIVETGGLGGSFVSTAVLAWDVEAVAKLLQGLTMIAELNQGNEISVEIPTSSVDAAAKNGRDDPLPDLFMSPAQLAQRHGVDQRRLEDHLSRARKNGRFKFSEYNTKSTRLRNEPMYTYLESATLPIIERIKSRSGTGT